MPYPFASRLLAGVLAASLLATLSPAALGAVPRGEAEIQRAAEAAAQARIQQESDSAVPPAEPTPQAAAEEPGLDEFVGQPQVSPAMRQQGLQPEARESDLVDPFTGELNYAYPLELPPGRGAAQPILPLRYRHSATEIYSPVGLGWELAIPKITRYSRRGVDGLYSENKFTSSLPGFAGELAPDSIDSTGRGSYLQQVRTQAGQFRFAASGWEITDSRGTRYLFGESAVAREESEDGSRVFAWYLTSIVDGSGNAVRYEYKKSQGSVYPTRISYGPADRPIEIRLEPYFSSPIPTFDILPSYARLFPVVEKMQPLSKIEIRDPTSQRRLSYEFTLEARDTYHLLTAITKKGTAADGTETALPPTRFSYDPYRGERSLVLQSLPTHEMETRVSGYSGMYPLWLYFDYDGDGWEDLVKGRMDEANDRYVPDKEVKLRKGTSWAAPQAATDLPTWIQRGKSPKYYPVFTTDMNGDGKSIICIDHSRSNKRLECRDGLQLETHQTSFLADLDADGLADRLFADEVNDDNIFVSVQKNKEPYEPVKSDFLTSFFHQKTGQAPRRDDDWKKPDFTVTDINRDNLADIIYANSYVRVHNGTVKEEKLSKKILLNKGDGTWLDATSLVDLPAYLYHCQDNKNDKHCENQTPSYKRLMDTTGDGLPDMISESNSTSCYGQRRTDCSQLYPGTGRGWSIPAGDRWNSFAWARGLDTMPTGINDDRFMDLDKDGILGNSFGPPNEKIGPTLGLPLLQSLQLPLGGKVTVEYTPASSYLDSAGDLANRGLPIPYLTVSRVTTAATAAQPESATGYSYADGQLYWPRVPGGSRDRELLGFGRVTETLPDGTVIARSYEHGTAETAFAGKGMLLAESIQSGSKTWQDSRLSYETATIKPNTSFAAQLRRQVQLEDGRAWAAEFDYDQHGNVVTERHLGEVTLGSSFSFTDAGTDRADVARVFARDTAGLITSLLQQETLTDQSGAILRETHYRYDDLPAGQVSRGNPTQIIRRIDATQTATTAISYAPDGLPTSITDPRGFVTRLEYDPLRLYPARIANAKGQVTTFEYDYLTGSPIRSTDPNGAVTELRLDGLGRPVATFVSDPANPGQLAQLEKTEYAITDSYFQVTRSRLPGGGAEPIISFQYFDSLQQPFAAATRVAASGSQSFVLSQQRYDARGQVAATRLPFFAASSVPPAFSTAPAAEVATFGYDALGRPTSAQNSLGSTTTSYSGWTRTVTDPLGHKKEFETDAFGRLATVREYLDGQTLTTRYEYSAAGELTRQTDSSGNTRAIRFDNLGRVTADELWHRPGETAAATAFRYDAAGNLLERTSPTGTVTTRTYDELGRVLTEDGSDTPEQDFSFGYDTGSYGLGRLATVTGATSTLTTSYDLLGRPILEMRVLEGRTFLTSRGYDLLGTVTSLTYPDSKSASYTFDLARRPVSVSLDAQPIARSIEYAPTGAPSRIEFGNGVTTTDTFDPARLYRLTARVTSSGSTRLQDLAYEYDAIGNLTTIRESAPTPLARTASYGYDALDRLTSATIAGTARSYRYDGIGNLLEKSESGSTQTLAYAGPHPHAATSLDSAQLSYDSAGRLTADGTRTLEWNYQDRIARVRLAGAAAAPAPDSGFDPDFYREANPDLTAAGITDSAALRQHFDSYGRAESRCANARQTNCERTGPQAFDAAFYAFANPDLAAAGITDSAALRQHFDSYGRAESRCANASQPRCARTDGRAPGTGPVPAASGDGLVFRYDHAGQRVAKVTLSGTVLYPNEYSEVRGEEQRDFVYLGDRRLATVSASGTLYHHPDHLTGASVTSDSTGKSIEFVDYEPYGSERIAQATTSFTDPYRFTGQEWDGETGLYDYGARQYDPVLGRFLSQDPWAGDLANPQTLNKYSYVLNNPLKYVDPTGMILEDQQRFFWTWVSIGLDFRGDEISSNFLIHSLFEVPGDLRYDDDSDVATSIRQSQEYSDLLTEIQSSLQRNETSGEGASEFVSNRDLANSIQHFDYSWAAEKTADNSYSITIKITDRYDFELKNYEEHPWIKAANNAAFFSQIDEVINNYNIIISLKDKITTDTKSDTKSNAKNNAKSNAKNNAKNNAKK